MRILRMGEAAGRVSRPETLRGRRRAVKAGGRRTGEPRYCSASDYEWWNEMLTFLSTDL